MTTTEPYFPDIERRRLNALDRAINYYQNRQNIEAPEVVEMARLFERYLNGEADEPQ